LSRWFLSLVKNKILFNLKKEVKVKLHVLTLIMLLGISIVMAFLWFYTVGAAIAGMLCLSVGWIAYFRTRNREKKIEELPLI